MAKAKLEVQQLTDTGLVTFATSVKTGMTDHAATFPDSAAAVTALGTALTEFTTKYQEAEDGKAQQKSRVDKKDEARRVVEDCLRTLARQVDEVAKGNADTVHLANMPATGDPSPVTMEQVSNLVATPGDNEGSVDWMCVPQKRAIYQLQTSADVNPRVWTNQKSSRRSSGTISGLPSLTRVWLRVAAEGAHNTGAWSDPALVTVP